MGETYQNENLRASRDNWNGQNTESNRTIDHSNNMGGNQRKLQNIRKGRYTNGKGPSGSQSNAIIGDQKSYRGAVIKNGLHISQQLSPGVGGAIMPNSTKNGPVTNV